MFTKLIKLDCMTDGQKNRIVHQNLNRISYKEGLRIQEKAHQTIKSSQNGTSGYLYLLEHHPVITNGRFGSDDNYVLPVKQIEELGVEVYNTDRGGDLTYHGPGQLVSYPILNLREFNLGAKAYICSLEQVLINLLSDYEIEASRREGYPGVWTNGHKIASIGVAVKNGITMHGSALNVNTDLDSFSLIVPCGISDVVVTSMEKVLDKKVPMDEVIDSYTKNFEEVFKTALNKENGPD